MITHHDARGFMQVAGTAVVAKPFPILQDLAFLRLCQAGEVGKAVHKALKIGYDGFHLCLLEHDLRHPNFVGRGIRTPGQGPGVCVIPIKSLPESCCIKTEKRLAV